MNSPRPKTTKTSAPFGVLVVFDGVALLGELALQVHHLRVAAFVGPLISTWGAAPGKHTKDF